MMKAEPRSDACDAKPSAVHNAASASTPRLPAREADRHDQEDAVDGDGHCGARTDGIDGAGCGASRSGEVADQGDIVGVGMTIRTTERSVNFQHPFALIGSERTYPAGAYNVVTDEELIDGLSFLAYRRVATIMFVPAPVPGGSSIEMINVDPADLEAAQLRDVAGHAP